MSKLSAIRNSLSAGIYSAPRSYGGQLSERLEIAMERTRDSSDVLNSKEHSNRLRNQTRGYGS